jgi:CheY-like chemotaxis protein
MSKALAKIKILVVDDDRDLLEPLTELLAFEGFSVLSALNGAEALACLRNPSPPDLVILDLMMPVMDGFKFLEIRRSDPRLSAIPVIVSSSNDSIGVDGADSIVCKPIDLELLNREIRRLTSRAVPLTRRRLRRNPPRAR